MNIIFCLFGVIPRSIKKTWLTINNNIIEILKKNGINVDIYVFNLNVENIPVDGKTLNQKDINIIPFDYFDEQLQSEIDIIINKKCENTCKFRSDYDQKTTRNALRQLYSEYMVGKFLENNNISSFYDLAFVCGPDYYIANNIKIEHIIDSYYNNILYTSQVNNGDGITNGFYFGKIHNMIKLLKRYNDFESSNKDYEYTVLKAIKNYNISHKFTDIIFFKIRANNDIHWQGGKKTDFIKDKNEKNNINLEYQNLLKKKNNNLNYSYY